MKRADQIALLLSLLAVLASFLVADRIYQQMAHIEDEMAYVWQAQAIAGSRLTVPSPPQPKSFLVPFVVDYNGQRFGKYPLGWPALLAIGVFLGARSLVNPLLAGLGVWFTYRLGQRTFGETVGLLAAGLTLISPFFLMNSGSLLSHPLGLVLSTVFVLGWLDAFPEPDSERPDLKPLWGPPLWVPTLAAGLCLGLLALTRPLTALAVGLPFGLHGLYLLARGDRQTRLRVLAIGLIGLALGSLLFVWQYAVSGDPLLNPYTLWWSYDKIGFGPGYGRTPQGHNLHLAWINTRYSLWVGEHDLFGWLSYSYFFLPLGLLAVLRHPLRNWRALLLGSVFPILVVVYMAYWVGAALYGPRYYYEALFSLTIFSAAGIAWLAGWPTRPGQAWRRYDGARKARPLASAAVLLILFAVSILIYDPARLDFMRGLYGIDQSRLAPFQSESAQELAPALVIVHPKVWTEYGALLELETPFLDTPFIFAYTRGPEVDAQVSASFPQRTTYHYYPDEPYRFYTAPRPEPPASQ